jgi:hypothetical protein
MSLLRFSLFFSVSLGECLDGTFRVPLVSVAVPHTNLSPRSHWLRNVVMNASLSKLRNNFLYGFPCYM